MKVSNYSKSLYCVKNVNTYWSITKHAAQFSLLSFLTWSRWDSGRPGPCSRCWCREGWWRRGCDSASPEVYCLATPRRVGALSWGRSQSHRGRPSWRWGARCWCCSTSGAWSPDRSGWPAHRLAPQCKWPGNKPEMTLVTDRGGQFTQILSEYLLSPAHLANSFWQFWGEMRRLGVSGVGKNNLKWKHPKLMAL